MSKIIIDIETVGVDFDSLDEKQQKYLLKFAETPEQEEKEKEKLALYPFTSQIVCIGMLNPDTKAAKLFFQGDADDKFISKDGLANFQSGTEQEILAHFWDNVKSYGQIITFNGRGFDCPFLMSRSAMLGVNITKNLMPYRYRHNLHCDLLEQLTYYNAVRKFKLDFYCKAFGIKSPKEAMDGKDVWKFFHKGKHREIAEYCYGDLKATASLFEKWEKYLKY